MRLIRPSGLLVFCILIALFTSYTYGTSHKPHNHDTDTELIIVFSGEEDGYLEPCGCEQTRTGGIAKRQSLLVSLRQDNQTILPLSLGDLTGHRRRQDEIKMETLLQAMGEMQYTLHNLGEKDLEMGAGALSYFFSSGPVELLSSNVVLPDTLGIKIYPYVIREVKVGDRDIRIGILGILSPSLFVTTVRGAQIIPPSEALGRLIKGEELRDVDLLILLSHAELEESIRLAEAFPEFQLIISGHDVDHPVITNVGGTIIAVCGDKGKNIGLFHYRPLDGNTSLEMVELDDRYPDSGWMLDLLRSYQQRLKDEDLLGGVEKFPNDEGFTYVGNVICGECHQAVFLHWKTTTHARAYETLVTAEHDYDPECVACHVTGLYYESGFTSLEETPGLKEVGCEGCHSPGSQHVETALKGQSTKGYGKVEPWGCESCHDLDHSSKFQYENYWQRIAHPKEQPKG